MQQLVDLIQDIGRAGLGLALGRFIVAIEDRLQEFEIPVAELVQTKR